MKMCGYAVMVGSERTWSHGQPIGHCHHAYGTIKCMIVIIIII